MKELVNLKKILVAGAFVMGAASVMSTAMVNSVHAEGDTADQTQTMPTNAWGDENGAKVYYGADGQKVTGLKKIDSATYYFDENGHMATGFMKANGHTYYFGADGKAVTGFADVQGKSYYFNEHGWMQTGLVKVNGKSYYFTNSGAAIKAGWVKCDDGKKRYGLGNGRFATGAKKIGKTYYGFKTYGTLDTKGFKKYGKYNYYVTKNGKLAKGWQAIGNYAYYFSKTNARRAYNTKIKYLKIGKSGRLGKAYAQAIRVMNKNGWNLRAAYRYAAGLRYANRSLRRSTPEAYATIGFTNHSGNCFVMASTFYIQAKLLGYNVHQISGHVGHNAAPHSWCYIVMNGRKWLYDPNFTNEHGRMAFHFIEGTGGTWRYVGGRRLLG